MKKVLSLLVASLMITAAFAQSEKYTKAMEALVPAVDTTRSVDGLTNLANSFERIANAEKTQWLPFYYAALCNINIANMYFQLQQPDKIDPIMDKAEPMLIKAEELEKNNVELMCLKKMLNSGSLGQPSCVKKRQRPEKLSRRQRARERDFLQKASCLSGPSGEIPPRSSTN